MHGWMCRTKRKYGMNRSKTSMKKYQKMPTFGVRSEYLAIQM